MWDHEEKFQILTALASMRGALIHIAKRSDIIVKQLEYLEYMSKQLEDIDANLDDIETNTDDS